MNDKLNMNTITAGEIQGNFDFENVYVLEESGREQK